MKLIDRYEFANGKAFEVYYLDANDQFLCKVPECDVIVFQMKGELEQSFIAMRPDEALIQARMLIDAVRQVTEGYSIGLPELVNNKRREVFADDPT